MPSTSEKLKFAKIVVKDKFYKVKESWQTSQSGKNALTKDPAYNAANPKHFIPMMDEDRYTDRSSAFDKIISATHKHFWDPLDKKYIDFDQPFDLENEHIVNPEGPFGLELEVPSIAEKLTEKQKIKLNNEKINELPIHKRALKGISLLEQHKGLFGNMTAYENLYAILELHIEDKNKIEAKIYQLLSYFGLQYLANVKANNMSGGEYKKISTLQRICNKDIKVLLLDEPMAALDPLSISSIKKFILELRDMGLSVIITDHNFFAIQDILDNCIIIRDGVVMVEGPPKDIIKDQKAIKYYLDTGFKI